MKGVSIVVDGMTGVGKTSLLEQIASEFELVPYEEVFNDENNLWAKYHTEGKEWCFPMQVSFLNNRYLQYREASKMPNAIMDRSIYSDPIFADLYYKTGDMKPEEYFVYKSLFRSLIESLNPPNLVIYLEVSADEALRRIKKRGRKEEVNTPDSYWRELHEVYEGYYENYKLSPLIRLNVDKLDFVNNPLHRLKVLDMIRERANLANLNSRKFTNQA